MILRAALLSLLMALPAFAQDRASRDATELAQEAALELRQAHVLLDQAKGAQDRVWALANTVRAYEDGLSALRAGLRQVTIHERALAQTLADKRQEITRLLGVLSAMGNTPAPLLLVHPSGPLGTARASQIVAEITPALQAEAEILRFDLETLQLLRGLQESTLDDLRTGLASAQVARAELAHAITTRRDLPRRYVADTEAMTALVQNATTLANFANGLRELPESALTPVKPPQFRNLALPVSGTVLRRFNERDAAGIVRPGWIVATQPGALVTSPADATVRYAGPLLDYGNVIVLEPARGSLLVLAGLRSTYVNAGEITVKGTPVGLMGGPPPTVGDFVTETGVPAGAPSTETLYIEVRNTGTPVDPASWFLE